MLISGLGDQHIDTVVNKLKNRYGVSVQLEDPKVPYRETIRKKRYQRKVFIKSSLAARDNMESCYRI